MAHLFHDEVDYEQPPGAGRQRRLIEHLRTLYRKDDLSGLLPLGSAMSMALPGESYKLAFTPGLLRQVYQRGQENLLPNPVDVLSGQGPDRGGYVASEALRALGIFPATMDPRATRSDGDGHWWIPSGRVFFDVNATVASPASTAAQEVAEARRHFFVPRKFADPFGQAALASYDKHDLQIVESRDAVGNTVTAQHDYRVLQPALITDPNGNRSQAAFDTLGMVVGTAVMGKTGESLGDTLTGFEAELTDAEIDAFHDALDPHVPAPAILKGATTRVVYDLHRFRRTREANPQDRTQWLPVYAATLARETHSSDPVPQGGLKIQISFSYSDGFGREIQKKIQAEPGPLVDGGPVVSPRWVGSGWTVFNNKGKPVRQYEPFFSQLPEKRHHFEFGVQVGVSPILFYDPVERVVATLHPNHTYEKVVFDPWQQTTYDVNDTVAANGNETGDPRTDRDIQGYVRPYFQTQPATWMTWHQQRVSGGMGPEERRAAEQAARHANTPTVAHFDTLGRPFLTIAHNRFDRNGAVVEESYATRVELDIEGNQRRVRDAIVQAGDSLGRIVMRYDYDMLGNRIHQSSMEAGERWMLNDATGKPIRAWNSRRFNFRTEYDPLRRPVRSFVQGGDPTEPNASVFAQPVLYEGTIYGDSTATGLTDAQRAQANLRGKVYKHFDSAGVVVSGPYDFKGNLLRSTRQLAGDYKKTLDWSQSAALEPDIFASSTRFDALNRPVELLTPHTEKLAPSTIRPLYNEANLLNEVRVKLRGAASETVFVANIDYNAKGQRTRIDYGNGTQTTYEYDEKTFRLIRLLTTRTPGSNGFASQIFANPAVVQDLRYTYDPAGNITQISDAALKTVIHANQKVGPDCRYTYDAIYRLIEATGREHIGQSALQLIPSNGNYRDYPFVGSAQSNDLQALRNYTERYEYDAVGNFERMIHQAANGGWTRAYEYGETSLIEDGMRIAPRKTSNRLSRTLLQPDGSQSIVEPYTYDAHGSMTRMPHLTRMQWDFKDQLSASARQVVNGGPAETTFYVYDAGGQRVRKVTERQNGSRRNERLYLGGFELYRDYDGNGSTVTLERETLHVKDDKQRIALVETRTLDPAGNGPAPARLIRYQLGNHLGSASLELDDQAQIISYEEYTPYGSSSYQAVRSQTETAKRYRYTGKERDEESGLYYHGARYYAAWLGRWISSDPSELIDGANTYGHVQGNPIRLIDPTGRESGEVDVPTVSIIPFKGSRPSPPEGSSSRGIYAADKARAAELLKNYPNPKFKFDIDHMEPHVTSPPGSTQTFRLRPSSHSENPTLSPNASTNRGEGHLARKKATLNRQQPDWRDPKSPNYARPKAMKGSGTPPAATPVQAPTAVAKPVADPVAPKPGVTPAGAPAAPAAQPAPTALPAPKPPVEPPPPKVPVEPPKPPVEVPAPKVMAEPPSPPPGTGTPSPPGPTAAPRAGGVAARALGTGLFVFGMATSVGSEEDLGAFAALGIAAKVIGAAPVTFLTVFLRTDDRVYDESGGGLRQVK